MVLTLEKQKELVKKLSNQFERFKTERGLVKSAGKDINPEDLLVKLKNAQDFAKCCRIPILYSDLGELEELKSIINYEVQVIQKDIIENY